MLIHAPLESGAKYIEILSFVIYKVCSELDEDILIRVLN